MPSIYGTVKAYWDFTDIRKLTFDGTEIIGVADLSGNGYNLTKITGISGPTHAAFTGTSYNAGYFNAAHALEYVTPADFKFLHDDGTGGTAIIWGLTLAATRPFFDTGGWNTTPSDYGVSLGLTAFTKPIASIIDNVPARKTHSHGTAIANNTAAVVSMRHSGGAANATLTVRLNGVDQATPPTYTPYTGNPDKVYIGAAWNNGSPVYLNGKIARMVCYSGSLSDATLTAIESAITR
jgi:hypothetical protein